MLVKSKGGKCELNGTSWCRQQAVSNGGKEDNNGQSCSRNTKRAEGDKNCTL